MHLLEGTLGQEVPLDPRQSLMRVVVGLLHQAQLLALLLVQPHSHGVLLLQTLQGQDEQLGVVLVAQRREGDGGELARLQPVHCGGVCKSKRQQSVFTTVAQATLSVIVQTEHQ